METIEQIKEAAGQLHEALTEYLDKNSVVDDMDSENMLDAIEDFLGPEYFDDESAE